MPTPVACDGLCNQGERTNVWGSAGRVLKQGNCGTARICGVCSQFANSGSFFAADTGDEALVGIPSCRKSGIRESFGLRRDNRTVEGFGPSAVRPVEDLLVDLPCWLGDVRPPFSEPGILQIVVHFVFVLQKCSARSGLKSAKEHRGWPTPP